MEQITKEAIKSRAAKLWEVTDLIGKYGRNGYRLYDRQAFDHDNGEFLDGKYDYTFEYGEHDGTEHAFHYYGLEDDVVPITGYTAYGRELAGDRNPEVEGVLKAFAADRILYDVFKCSELHYDGKIRVTVDTCIRPTDTENMTDGLYEEITFTVNRKGQVFQSKPKEWLRSVLVALNID